MPTNLILGAGPIARHLNTLLTGRGDDVVVATRSGTQLPGARSITLDASDPDALTGVARGCDTIFVCTNPAYHQWPELWPPLIDSVITAAETTGAGVVLMGNLYPYGRPSGPMSATTPENPTESKGRVRADIWSRLLSSHQAGKLRAAEVRASDYFGAGAGESAHAGSRFFQPLLAGKAAMTVGSADAKHSWAYLPDIAATLAAVADQGAWGRIWLAPHSGQASLKELATMINPSARLRQYPGALLSVLGWFMPQMREVATVRYQHTSDYLVDDTETREALGLGSTPLAEAVATTAAAYTSTA